MKKTILAPAVALSLGLTGALGFAAAPVFANESAPAPQVTLSKEALTATEFGNDGVTITIKGEGNKDYSVTVKRDGNLVTDDPVTTDADGNATLKVGGDVKTDDSVVGTYTVDVFDGQERVGGTEFEVTAEDSNEGDDPQPGEEEEAPAKDPALNLSDKKVNAADFVNEEKGLNAVVSNLEPGTEVTFHAAGTSGNAKNVRPFKQTVTADKDGNAIFNVGGMSEDNPSAYLGKYTMAAEFDGQKLEDSFEVVSGKGSEEEEAPAKDPALSLSDKKVTAADFVNKKKGVVATVSGLEPGTKVKFTVTGVSGNAKNVKPYETTVIADEDGNAVFSAAGLSKSNPSAYLGKYTVTAEFDDQKLEDSFEVVSGKGSSDADESEETGSGGGSVSGGASDDVSGSTTSGSSDYLPRTGQGLGGLAAGVALLTIGGATVLLTRRTRKA